MTRINVALDVLDAALMEYLPELAKDSTINRKTVTSALIIFYLRHNQLGDLGEIKLREISDSQTDLGFHTPPFPSIFEIFMAYSENFLAWVGQKKPLSEQENFEKYKDKWYEEFYQERFGEEAKNFWADELSKIDGESFTFETLQEDFQAFMQKVRYQQRVDYKQALLDSLLERLRVDDMDIQNEKKMKTLHTQQSSPVAEEALKTADWGEGSDIPQMYRNEQERILKACVCWVYRPDASKTFRDFLDELFGYDSGYSDKVFYKKHLPRAAELGLVKKVGGRYRPVYKSIREAFRIIDTKFVTLE